MVWTPERRRELVKQADALRNELFDVERELGAGGGPGARALAERMRQLEPRLKRCESEYRAGLPLVALSRSPINGQPIVLDFDPVGIDGLWWSYDDPVRRYEPLPETLLIEPPSLLALTGAVRLGPQVEVVDFLVCPGPQVPFVVPRLLGNPGVVAVVSSISIGPHMAYPIAYFARNVPAETVLPNTWGTRNCLVPAGELAPDGRPYLTIGESLDFPGRDYDFDLQPWIERHQLFWIDPNDKSLTLRSAPSRACPYLGLPGRKSDMYIRDGDIWAGEE